jgi:hypothetical protein
MGDKMRYVFRRHLFLLIGLLAFFLFFLVAWLDSAGKSETAHALAVPMRILIVPTYLVWLVLTMARVAIGGAGRLPVPFEVIVSFISLVAGFAPYALADYIRNRCRRSRNQPPAPVSN